MTFGEVVLHYLNTLGVSQSELARRMGTGRQTVNSIIKNKGLRPTLDEKSPPTRRPRGVPRGTGGEGAAIIG